MSFSEFLTLQLIFLFVSFIFSAPAFPFHWLFWHLSGYIEGDQLVLNAWENVSGRGRIEGEGEGEEEQGQFKL